MGQIVDPCCGRYSLRSGAIIILVWILIVENIGLLVSIYNLFWEESSSSQVTASILLVKYLICIFAIVVAFFGLCTKKAVFLIPVLLTRVVVFGGDVIDLIWYIFTKKTVIPTSLKLLYTEDFFIEIVLGTLFLVLSCYFIFVLYGHYNELKKDDPEKKKLPDDA